MTLHTMNATIPEPAGHLDVRSLVLRARERIPVTPGQKLRLSVLTKRLRPCAFHSRLRYAIEQGGFHQTVVFHISG